MRLRPLARLAGLSPRRRALLAVVALIVAALAAVGGVQLAGAGGPSPATSANSANPAGPGPASTSRTSGSPSPSRAPRRSDVLLVPGYGGSTTALGRLAARIRASGRRATVVQLAGNGTGDLREQARVLNGYVNQALSSGSGPVTVIGYSAGGVVAWLWDVDYHATAKVWRFITLGSPLHGANLAALGAAFDPSECPVACQQLVPGSSLLTTLQRAPAATRPPWLSLWTTQDQVVQPPGSARLGGAVNVPLQSICPGENVTHSQLPVDPLVTGIVLRALGAAPLAAPGPGQCQSLQALGR